MPPFIGGKQRSQVGFTLLEPEREPLKEDCNQRSRIGPNSGSTLVVQVVLIPVEVEVGALSWYVGM